MLGGSFSPAMGEERPRQSLSQPYIYTSCIFVPKKALVLRSIAARVLKSALLVWLYVCLTQQPTVVTKKNAICARYSIPMGYVWAIYLLREVL